MSWYDRMVANATLQVGDMWVADEAYRPVVELCRARETASGLPKPPGLEGTPGEYWLRFDVLQATGLIRFTLWYRDHSNGKTQCGVKIGWYVIDYLPERPRMPAKPVRTHGRQIVIRNGGHSDNTNARQVRVLVDADGLPVPIPEPLWAACRLE